MTQSTFHRFEASVVPTNPANGHPERHRPLFRRVLSRVAPASSFPNLEAVSDLEPVQSPDSHLLDLWEAFSAYATAQFDGERRETGNDKGRLGSQRLLDSYGIDHTVAKSLSLGLYTTPDDIRVYLRSVGFSDSAIEDSGLVSDLEGRLRHDWSGSLVGPVRDRFGNVIDLFSMQSGTNWQPTRYRFLHGFTETLAVGYGAEKAFGADLIPTRVVLVDDLLDAVALHDAGVMNVLAIGGSGADFSSDRWEQLADLGVLEVELVFRQSALRENSIRSALEHALKARRAPQVWVMDSSRFGESTSSGDYLRRHGATAFLATISTPSLAYYGKEFGGRRFVTYPSSATARFAVVPVAPETPAPLEHPPVKPQLAKPAAIAPEPVAYAPVVARFDRTAYLTAMRPWIDRYSANEYERNHLWQLVHGVADALDAGQYSLARERTAALPPFEWTTSADHWVHQWHNHFATYASYSQYSAYAPFTPFAPYSHSLPAEGVTSQTAATPEHATAFEGRTDWNEGEWRADASIDRLCRGTSLPYGLASNDFSGETELHPLTLLTIACRADRLRTAANRLLDELMADEAGSTRGSWLVGCDCHPDELMLHVIREQANRLANGPGHSLLDVQCRMRGVEPTSGFQDKPWLIDEAIDRLRTSQSRFAFVPTSFLLANMTSLVMPETGLQPDGVIYVADSFETKAKPVGPYSWSGSPYAPHHADYRREIPSAWGTYDFGPGWTASWATDFATTLSNRLAGKCRLIAVVPPTRTDAALRTASNRSVQ